MRHEADSQASSSMVADEVLQFCRCAERRAAQILTSEVYTSNYLVGASNRVKAQI
jgi:hypothetical protein